MSIPTQVDPARVKEDAEESLRENQTKLIHLSKLVFDLLVASLDQVRLSRLPISSFSSSSVVMLRLLRDYRLLIVCRRQRSSHMR
jgi:hypothetical protein